MVLQVYDTNISANGVIASLGETDDALVRKNVRLESLNDIVMVGTGSGHSVTVKGDVVGHIGGMALGDSALDTGQQLTIAGDASVIGSTFNGVMIYGSGSVVHNQGFIYGGGNAIALYGDDPGTMSRLINTGLIVSEDQSAAAIYRNGEEDFRLVNNGKITAKADWAYDGSASDGRQTIVNSGLIDSGIQFGGGNDVYAGAHGRLLGTISGGAGNDRLTGGRRFEQFAGDEGRDIIKGGKGADEFVYHLLNDSHVERSGRDLIKDFRHSQGDRIILDEIDAIIGGGDEMFTFIGKADFSNAPGELRYYYMGRNTIVEGNVDGDGLADFAIEISGRVKLFAGDFEL